MLASTDAAGDVDYDALPVGDLDEALETVAQANLDGLQGNDRYAFLVNAYNLCVLDAVRRRLMRNGRIVRSLRRPWTRLLFFFATPMRVGGRRMSLYRLEFHLIKPHLKADPRGHFALVCAATGCPPLRGGQYHGEALDEELDLAGRAFFRPGGGYVLDRKRSMLRLGRILKWYRRDFAKIGSPIDVFMRFAPDDDVAWVQAHDPKIRFMPYDWSVNQAKAASSAAP